MGLASIPRSRILAQVGVEFAEHHKSWIQEILNNKRVVLVAPPESAKTTVMIVLVVDDVVVVVSILEIPPQAVIKSPHTVARIIFCTHALTTFRLAKCEMRQQITSFLE